MTASAPPSPAPAVPAPAAPALKRSLGLGLLTLYGLGTTIGAGIYVLVGAVVGAAGSLAPWSFLLAALLAGLAATSYAGLSRRYQKSAGEAHFVLMAFGRRWLSLLVGLLVVLTAVISAATIARGAAGYLSLFLALPPWALLAGAFVLLGGVALWGIRESATAAGLCTLVEVGGLVLVVGAGLVLIAGEPVDPAALVPTLDGAALDGILGGTLVAFFAFVGFEHMVNVAEEVKAPERTIPRAILLTLLITALLYGALAVVAVLAVPPAELAAAPAPLALIWERAGGVAWLLGAIGVFATVNGLLTMIILGARVLYGLAQQGSLPALLGRVHPTRRTPLPATLLVVVVALLAALWLPIATLAEATSLVTLLVFALVSAALLRIQAREGAPWRRRLPPLLGLLATGGLLLYELAGRLVG